jgi:N-acetylglutamate synthase-like GNAT family acetyltransferase
MQREELTWVNEQYHSVGFVPSTPSDHQLIAEVDGQRAGLGRLVPISDGVYELGGIFVLPQFRGRAVARKIVEHLLDRAGDAQLYCIPFTSLSEFYKGMGFVESLEICAVPEKIKEKYRWCQQTYLQKVLLLEISADEAASYSS